MSSGWKGAFELLQSTVAIGLSNIDSSRVRNPSLHVRKEEWTEQIGGKKNYDDDDEKENDGSDADKNGSSSSDVWNLEDASVRLVLDARNPIHEKNEDSTITLTLTQYRVAWQEQLLLRIARIPHIVQNSPYLATESTGALPYLTDLQTCALIGKRNVGGMAQKLKSKSKSKSKFSTISNHKTKHEKIHNDRNDNYNSNNNEKTTQPLQHIRSSFTESNSHIVDYLQSYNSSPHSSRCNLDLHLTPGQKADSAAYTHFIEDLDIILQALRYGHTDTWNQIYKPQSIHARLYTNTIHTGTIHNHIPSTTTTTTNTTTQFAPTAWIQTWSERVVYLHHLKSFSSTHKHTLNRTFLFPPDNQGDVSLPYAIHIAKASYAALDARLEQNQKMHSKTQTAFATSTSTSTSTSTNIDSPSPSFVGLLSNNNNNDTQHNIHSNSPTHVDILLFSHLAEALCNVHLVTILAEFQNLVRFFQTIYETYFGSEYTNSFIKKSMPNNTNDDIRWIHWNNNVNAVNQFNQHIPIGGDNDKNKERRQFMDTHKDALTIMQSIALHCHDLSEVLNDVSLQRKGEESHLGRIQKWRMKSGDLIQRLRMGGDIWKNSLLKIHQKQTLGHNRHHQARAAKEETYASKNDMARKNKEHIKKLMRDAKTNDELWMSGVLAFTVLGFLITSSSSS